MTASAQDGDFIACSGNILGNWAEFLFELVWIEQLQLEQVEETHAVSVVKQMWRP